MSIIIVVGTIVFSIFEGWNLLDAFYFTMITMLSVGYGDLSPTTYVTKILSVAYAILGLILIFLTIGLAFEILIMHIRSKRK
ncbi:MAG: potassium channel family protein [Candidatus Odinarchaeia archaeon]